MVTSSPSVDSLSTSLQSKLCVSAAKCDDMILSPQKLMDMLLVTCPNFSHCDEVLPRSDLAEHLKQRCRGAPVRCLRVDAGCPFRGSRHELQHHLTACSYRNSLPVSLATLNKAQITAGEITTIDVITKANGLGIGIVGGVDTPLISVIVQEVYAGGMADKDGRLAAGDYLLEVNGHDLSAASHEEARLILQTALTFDVSALTVYREKAGHLIDSASKEEILKISLRKEGGRLGVILIGRDDASGLHVFDVVPGSRAATDRRLRRHDRILQINGRDVSHCSRDYAMRLIQQCHSCVDFVVSRKVPSVHFRYCSFVDNTTLAVRGVLPSPPPVFPLTETLVVVGKESGQPLGLNVAGGRDGLHGDTPIYVTNVDHGGCAWRTRQISAGDVILCVNERSLLGASLAEAVSVLQHCLDECQVSVRLLSMLDSQVNDFSPSWTFWLSLPSYCAHTRQLTIRRDISEPLGFAIVGGCEASGDYIRRTPICVKSVMQQSPSSRDGRLRSGDVIVSVNGLSLTDVTHGQAVALLKAAGSSVTMSVVSWPGTPV